MLCLTTTFWFNFFTLCTICLIYIFLYYLKQKSGALDNQDEEKKEENKDEQKMGEKKENKDEGKEEDTNVEEKKEEKQDEEHDEEVYSHNFAFLICFSHFRRRYFSLNRRLFSH